MSTFWLGFEKQAVKFTGFKRTPPRVKTPANVDNTLKYQEFNRPVSKAEGPSFNYSSGTPVQTSKGDGTVSKAWMGKYQASKNARLGRIMDKKKSARS